MEVNPAFCCGVADGDADEAKAMEQGNVNPIAVPTLPSVVIESPSKLAPTTSAVELPEPDGQEEIEGVDKVMQNLIVPEVDMTFDSEEKAYEMYNTYTGKTGFSIRKSHSKLREDKSVYQKYMVCSNEGHRQNKSSQKDITRTGCNASLSKMKEKSVEVPPVLIECPTNPLKGKISFKIPQVVKGAKQKRTTNILEKNSGKKKTKKKGDANNITQNRDESAHPNQSIDLDAGGSGATTTEQFSAIPAPYIQGGFTDLLLGVQQDAAMSSSARKLYFDENL